MSDKLVHITGTEEFNSEVLNAKEDYVFVDFWAPWCGPCLRMEPSVAKMAEELTGQVKVVKVNVDESPELSGQFQIMSIPTMMLYKPKNEGESERSKDVRIGFMPEPVIYQWLQENGVDTDKLASTN